MIATGALWLTPSWPKRVVCVNYTLSVREEAEGGPLDRRSRGEGRVAGVVHG
jgi:hypothetical protein